MVQTYIQKKYDTTQAIQWTGDNTEEVIEFGTIKLCEKSYKEIDFPPEGWLPDDVRNNELWISNMSGGDIIKKGDYAVFDGGEYLKVDKEDFESNWVLTEKNNYRAKEKKKVQAIQWCGNTDEVLEFIGKEGGLDGSKKTILLMNFFGGSVVLPDYFIVKIQNEDGEHSFISSDEDSFRKEYEPFSVKTEMDEIITPPSI